MVSCGHLHLCALDHWLLIFFPFQVTKSAFWLMNFCKHMEIPKDILDSCLPPALFPVLQTWMHRRVISEVPILSTIRPPIILTVSLRSVSREAQFIGIFNQSDLEAQSRSCPVNKPRMIDQWALYFRGDLWGGQGIIDSSTCEHEDVASSNANLEWAFWYFRNIFISIIIYEGCMMLPWAEGSIIIIIQKTCISGERFLKASSVRNHQGRIEIGEELYHFEARLFHFMPSKWDQRASYSSTICLNEMINSCISSDDSSVSGWPCMWIKSDP